ncbi:DUF4241 domain-containing protein [Allokutzneria sp. A3M-2-11 16]|uniref:DUF4241 domain-containing protein n=1 Tax=Allokutzneria sp. A3M-2-11 16 TaxID=2962043 RepID=UPI0020B6B4E5|nr:DUF4241 domain-containing protein [Allokutzneria sp. A3M-2-11 16]MCP3798087.1 DUF4241 domain-containing protein [Allokutzneria sp. A3M-2-11 16]
MSLSTRTNLFDALFAEGELGDADESGARLSVRVQEAGKLNVPSGRLIACDPNVVSPSWPMPPFTVSFPPGHYPVLVSLVHRGAQAQGHPTVAAVKVRLSEQPVQRWELALTPDQDPAELADDEFFGYGVDAGTGCFADAEAIAAMERLVDDGEGPLCEGLAEAEGAVNVTDAESGLNVVAFQAGYGDGSYPTWLGRATDGSPAAFVTDFFVVPHSTK